MNTAISNYEKIKDDLKDTSKSISLLNEELNLLQKILYKNKNQHYRTHYFQHLKMVHRGIRRLNLLSLENFYKLSLSTIENLEVEPGKHHLAWSTLSGQLKKDIDEILCSSIPLLSNCIEIMEGCKKCYKSFASQLAMSYFMPFSLTINAMMGRFYTLIWYLCIRIYEIHGYIQLGYLNEVFKANPLRSPIVSKQLESYRLPSRILSVLAQSTCDINSKLEIVE